MTESLFDSYHRQIDYMRISVTDRCNLRCIYCNSSTRQHLSHNDILRYEEISRVVRIAAKLGVHSIRLTGGEPTVRPRVVELVSMLRGIAGIKDISMTTNAVNLTEMAQPLKQAGLDRVNISLDTFRPERFAAMCGVGRLDDVLLGIEAARKAGLNPVKTNTVVLRGINDDEVVDFARKSVTDGWNVRFIEEMPLVDNPNGYKLVSVREIKELIEREMGPMQPHDCPSSGHGPARSYHLGGGGGTIGLIGPVTDCFCDTCNRFRLTADGKLRPCLLREDEVDLKSALRAEASDEELEALMLQAVAMKQEKHQLDEHIVPHGRNMRQIGG
ncbi:MAG: GTP 3',8-cyclase MoaA [Dehalococcoidia bacterium]|nr:GTP 3',8-cyclase MoaA [Dehalococcoidia bacterium]